MMSLVVLFEQILIFFRYLPLDAEGSGLFGQILALLSGVVWTDFDILSPPSA